MKALLIFLLYNLCFKVLEQLILRLTVDIYLFRLKIINEKNI